MNNAWGDPEWREQAIEIVADAIRTASGNRTMRHYEWAEAAIDALRIKICPFCGQEILDGE